jgi:hypothetical protein
MLRLNMNLDEEYVHFQESITSLNRAWRTLCELENASSGNAIWSAAFRMAIVEYCKPFTISQVNERERHKLPFPSLKEQSKEFHTRLLELRSQVMAHFDLSILDAEVCYNKSADSPVPLIVKNILGNLPKISEMKAHVESVLDALYEQEA